MLRNEELEVDVYSPLPKWEDLAPKICMLTREKKPGETIDSKYAYTTSLDLDVRLCMYMVTRIWYRSKQSN